MDARGGEKRDALVGLQWTSVRCSRRKSHSVEGRKEQGGQKVVRAAPNGMKLGGSSGVACRWPKKIDSKRMRVNEK